MNITKSTIQTQMDNKIRVLEKSITIFYVYLMKNLYTQYYKVREKETFLALTLSKKFNDHLKLFSDTREGLITISLGPNLLQQ